MKKIISGILCALMLLCAIVPAYAVEPANIATSPGAASSEAQITAEACEFSVTVPAALPIAVDTHGAVATASNAKIVNMSAGPIEVKDVDFVTANGWSIVDYNKSFVGEQMDKKELGFVINGAATVGGDFVFNDAEYPIICRNTMLPLTYDAAVAPQTATLTAEKVADVVFTIGWYEDTVIMMSAPPAEGEPAPIVEVSEGDKATLIAQGAEEAQLNWFNSDSTVVEISETKGTTSSNSGTGGTIDLHEGEHVQTLIAGWKANISAKAEGSAIIEAYEGDTLISITTVTVEKEWPEPVIGTSVTDDFYEYRYGQYYNSVAWLTPIEPQHGWGVRLRLHIDNSSDEYPAFQTTIRGYDVTNASSLFYNYKKNYLRIDNLDTSKVTDISYMFYGCNVSYIYNDTFTSLDTSKVSNMEYMFANNVNVTTLNLSSFDTSSVTNMRNMFYNDGKLTSLNLNNFDTSLVTNMYEMFRGCSALKTLEIDGFNTKNVTTMRTMFYGCSSLTLLNLNSFDTSAVTNMGSMFYGCAGLTQIDLSSFNLSNTLDVDGILRNCSNVKVAYARTQADADKLNASSNKPTTFTFVVKPAA